MFILSLSLLLCSFVSSLSVGSSYTIDATDGIIGTDIGTLIWA
jgi:hypothetical protein